MGGVLGPETNQVLGEGVELSSASLGEPSMHLNPSIELPGFATMS